jgi:nucleoside phosphorylase
MPSQLPEQPHQVVLTLLPDTGNVAAAAACANLVRSFGSIEQVIMVGIAAGIPDPDHPLQHVRLGDIVVATWGVVDYDHVVDRPDGEAPRQSFPRPSPLLTPRARMLEALDQIGVRPWEEHLERAVRTLDGFARPPADTDRLFTDDTPGSERAHPDPAASGHRDGLPKVHLGRIGSADRAMRNAAARDDLAARYGIRAIEMEGNGVGRAVFASGREWFVVRGISDYGDSRTDQLWRKYAAVVAAAYVRALLAQCAPSPYR